MFDIFSSKILANLALCKFELKKVNVCSSRYLNTVVEICHSCHRFEVYLPVFLGMVMPDEIEAIENNNYLNQG